MNDVNEQRLSGRTAVVTGASRGIGLAVARELAGAGVTVALVARTHEELSIAAKEIAAGGGAACAIPADLSSPDQLERATSQIRAELGPVDILINNAAVVWPLGPSVQVDLAQFTAAISINLLAVVSLSVALLPDMIERGWGRIVNVSSGVAAKPDAMIGANAYATSKAAVEGHTLNLAAELHGTGVTVNAFRPGMVDTAMQTWIRAQPADEVGPLSAQFHRAHADGRLIAPGDSARALVAHLHTNGSGEVWGVGESTPH
jgi:NAD(P)-dependent dehydrogenase (short-subunit alcohol dehydrogenase family)